jgi:hypothetical protein
LEIRLPLLKQRKVKESTVLVGDEYVGEAKQAIPAGVACVHCIWHSYAKEDCLSRGF